MALTIHTDPPPLRVDEHGVLRVGLRAKLLARKTQMDLAHASSAQWSL